MKKLLNRINDSLAYRFGLKFIRANEKFSYSRSFLLNLVNPDLILDCGANKGQWVSDIAPLFKNTPIISIEPLNEPFLELEKLKNKFGNLQTFKFALSNESSISVMQVASNGGASSTLSSPTNHLKVNPNVTFDTKESVEVKTLDSLIELKGFKKVFIKLDLQGYEFKALQGAAELLANVALIEIESSLTPQYLGETSHHELILFLKNIGFEYFSGSVPRTDLSGRQWDLNSLLVRSKYINVAGIQINE